MTQITIKTNHHSELLAITGQIEKIVGKSGVEQGQCIIFCPHTTAGLTVNENADPDVVHDILYQLDQMVPWHQSAYRHGEGNSAAHVKASLLGCRLTLIIDHGRLLLGTWQGIYLAEFDGPRTRKVYVHIVKD